VYEANDFQPDANPGDWRASLAALSAVSTIPPFVCLALQHRLALRALLHNIKPRRK
jgi:hypothetical protein